MWQSVRNRRMKHAVLGYIGASAGCGVVSVVYAQFSHGVASPAMTWLFLIPLVLGALPFFIGGLIDPCAGVRQGFRVGNILYGCGVATVGTGMFLRGVFDIAGTASPYVSWFFLLGAVLMLSGALRLLTMERGRHYDGRHVCKQG